MIKLFRLLNNEVYFNFIGLENLTNLKRGDYYGVASTWSMDKKRTLGVVLLKKACDIFMAEGERQIKPVDI